MAKNKSFLEEAVVAAKEVREAAIQHAYKELEENLTPSIKEALAQKLEEELDIEGLEESNGAVAGFKPVKEPKKAIKEEIHMGQKVSPKGMRIGVIKDWDARWYADKNYEELLHEDLKVRKYVKRCMFSTPNFRTAESIGKQIKKNRKNAVLSILAAPTSPLDNQ